MSLRLERDEGSSTNPTYQTGFPLHGLADWFRCRLNCLPVRALFNVPDPKVKTDEGPTWGVPSLAQIQQDVVGACREMADSITHASAG